MKLYALAITACRLPYFGAEVIVTRRADSKEHAIAIGVEVAKKEWKIKNGWTAHRALVVQVPDNFIVGAYNELNAYRQLDSEERRKEDLN